ncbi:PqqD family peptide modification chaperone [Bradyrhizobium sp. SUTN9-2]|uniref:PqqD family peptide modification chaperone n=1 Tax=Bradyrhizobium sp. SUTN9-2 TaxID=1167456 RepID=UPI00130483DD|nr:PqqD family peptide modification chaperone [Bradyrhizobium sp. SUTN9-2]
MISSYAKGYPRERAYLQNELGTAVCEMLDGRSTVSDIVVRLGAAQRRPASLSDVLEYLRELDQLGFLEFVSSATVPARRAPFQILVIPYRECSDHRFEVALLRRSDLLCWQGIAGGGQDLESPIEAAARELAEEAGLAGQPVFPLQTVASVPARHFPHADWCPRLAVVREYSFSVKIATDQAISISSEHSEFGWFALDEAVRLAEWDSTKTAVQELAFTLTNANLA